MKTLTQSAKSRLSFFSFSIVFTLFFNTLCVAQKDLIVKKDSTEIRCTILKVTPKKCNFSILNNRNKFDKMSIPTADVLSVYCNKFQNDSIAMPNPIKKEIIAETSTIENDSIKSWSFTFGIGLNLENVLEFNKPEQDDKKIFSATTALDFGLNYFKEGNRFAMTNEAHWTASIQKEGISGNDRIIRTSDELLTLHDFSITLSKNSKWNFNLIAKTATYIFTIFDGDYFKDYNEAGKSQSFLNPYDVTLSPGIKYQPNSNFRISISPYSVNMYGLLDQDIANTGYYTETFDENNNYSLYVFTKLGAEMNIWYDKKVKNWLEMQYRLGVASDYLSKSTITGTMDGLFITKIRILKNLSLAHRGVLKGDFITQPFKPYYKQNILLSFSKSF